MDSSMRGEAEGRRRVLVVNDEAPFRELLSIALAENGHVVERARDGEEARDMVRSRHYDRIVLNLWMPRMGGQQLYQRIKGYREELAKGAFSLPGLPAVRWCGSSLLAPGTFQ
jgi:CheY-like chemotaxis protein